MYKVYENFGWNITDNSNKYLKDVSDAWKDPSGMYFPTITEYIDTIVELVKDKGFGERMEGEYLGTLQSQLQTFATGVKGLIFSTRRSINFDELLDKKVVFELEELKSGDDKAFIMGDLFSPRGI